MALVLWKYFVEFCTPLLSVVTVCLFVPAGVQQDRTASDGRHQGLADQGGLGRGVSGAGGEGGQHLQPGVYG